MADHEELIVNLAALLADIPLDQLCVGDILDCIEDAGFAIVRNVCRGKRPT